MSDPSLPAGLLDLCPRCSAPLVAGMVICPACEVPLADVRGAATGPLDPKRQFPVAFESGQSLGDRYTIVERVGAGGMGLIYKALDRKLGRTVAVKLIQAALAERPGAHERFRREILLAQQVTHPNVCRVHDLGEFDGQPFISMEFVEGQTLETLIQSMGHLSPSQTVALAKQICAGLGAIHQRGIVHRDLKPSNVMVDRLGHVVLMDFGMAYHEDQQRLTQAGAVFGTLGYLAPEQARGRPETRSDLYALGLILYEMLTGRRPPGDDDSLPLALREKDEPCPPPSHFSPEVPEALDRLVMRCLAREPDQRYASAGELGEFLQQFEGPLTRSGLLTQGLPPARTGRRRTAALLGGGAFLLVAAAFAGHSWRAAPPAVQPHSVALLPLAYSGPPEEAYLKDLLPLVLSQELQGTPGLSVTPFSVSRTFGAQEDPRAVARQLGVGLVVAGTAGASAGGVRTLGLRAVTAEGQESWADRQSGTATALLQQAPDVARRLARAVGLPPRPLGPTRAPEALKHYLEGAGLLEGWDVSQNDLRATAAFEAAIAADADFAEAHAGLARAHLNQFNALKEPGLVEQAAAAAERSVSLAPALPEARLALGLVYLARGRSAEARLELERAQAVAPADDTVCRRIAGAYARMGRTAAADELFKRAIDLRPGYWQNHNAYGSHLLRTGRLQEAEALFRKVIELRPESDTGYSNLGATLIMAGRFEEAEPVLLAALKIRPDEAAHTNLGFAYYATGRFEAAAREWESAVTLGHGRAEHFGNLGVAYRHLGRAAAAARAYKRAAELWAERLAVDSQDAEARTGLAITLAGRGDCAGAERQTRLAGALSTSQPYVAYYGAVAAAICGRASEAERLVLRAIDGGAVADVRTNPDLQLVASRPAVRDRLARAASHPGPDAR